MNKIEIEERKIIAEKMSFLERTGDGLMDFTAPIFNGFFMPKHLAFIQGTSLIFGVKKRKIQLQDIEIIHLRFSDHGAYKSHGRIIIHTKAGKKFKQRYIRNIYNVLIRILRQFVKFNIEHPKILYTGEYGNKMEMTNDLAFFETLLRETGELFYPTLLLYKKTSNNVDEMHQ
ncbi:MAG: hypothetical protein FWE13_04610 [Firmicutes bacterium]|nr:hypothetical protein [Bacillota bacterium]